MLRLLHNRSIVKYFLAALGLAFAFYFAWSFYPFGEWSGTTFSRMHREDQNCLASYPRLSWAAVC